MASIQERAKTRQAQFLGKFKEDVVDENGRSRTGANHFTQGDRREYAIACKAERRDAGLVDGLRFETEEESAEYLHRREQEDAAHRPDRKGQVTKKRDSFEEKAEFKERDADYEKQKEMVAAMSREKARRMVGLLKKKYGGVKWPTDVCRLYRLLQQKALTIEERFSDYGMDGDPREMPGVVSAGGM